MLPVAAAVSRSSLRRWALTALAAATLGLSACGGGDRSVEYKPTAMLVFGDEHSAFHTVTVPGTPSKVLEQLTWGIDPVVPRLLGYCTEALSTCDPEESASAFTESEPFQRRLNVGLAGDTELRTLWFFAEGTVTGLGARQALFERVYTCSRSAIWVQSVANSFGLGFGERAGCPGEAGGAENFAQSGHKVADVISGLQAQRSRMRDGVLVTVMVGQNDVLEQYTAIAPGFTESDIRGAVDVLAERGRNLASAVKLVTDTGAKVILVKTPNLQRSPFATTEGGRADVLNRLSEAFNNALYINPEITRLGRSIAGVDTNEVVLANTTTSGYINEVSACSKALVLNPANTAVNPTLTEPTLSPGAPPLQPVDITNLRAFYSDLAKLCNSQTLVVANPSNYVWATPLHLGPGAHSYIGSVAFNRAANQF